MISWLLSIVLAYLFFGLASLGDKLVLSGESKPRLYVFYIGLCGALAVLLIPFADFGAFSKIGICWSALDALIHIIGIYAMFVAVKKFEVSKVIATIGATQPIFIFILTWIFWGPQEIRPMDILAFLLLFLGSIIISFEKNSKTTGDYLKITIFSSVMLSLDYIFAKFVFLSQSFLPGLIWINIFMFLTVLFFLFNKGFRSELFSKQRVLNRKEKAVFLFTQACGGTANLLQNFSISLAPVVYLATINSLRGIQYAFLFLITSFLSFFFPNILNEDVSGKVILQKIISIFLIALGLAILAIF